MGRNSNKLTKTVPDAVIKSDFGKIFTAVFGSEEAPNDEAKQKEVIASLSLDDQIGFAAYVGRRIQEFSDLFGIASSAIAARPVTEFADEDSLVSVVDSNTGETVGGLSVKTEKTTSYSTKDKKNREAVLQEIVKQNLQEQYTRTSIELKNETLFKAKEDGTLPASIGSLLTATTTEKRAVTFRRPAEQKGE